MSNAVWSKVPFSTRILASGAVAPDAWSVQTSKPVASLSVLVILTHPPTDCDAGKVCGHVTAMKLLRAEVPNCVGPEKVDVAVVDVAKKKGDIILGSTPFTAVGKANIVPVVVVAERGTVYAAKANCGTRSKGNKYLSKRINVKSWGYC